MVNAEVDIDAACSQSFGPNGSVGRRCPRCGQGLVKKDGCDHFTCSTSLGCMHEFCFQCQADYGDIRQKGNR